MNSRTKITLAWQLHEQGMNNSQIAKHLEVHRETVGLWLRGVGEQGLLPFLDTYRQANKQSRPARQVPLSTKRLVWQLREREHGCCGQKIAYFLKKEHGIHLSAPKIYEVLAEKYVIRSKWKKNQQRGPVPQASAPRQVVQMDTIDFGRVFAFTAVDIFSREADVLLAAELTSSQGKAFLHQCMTRRFTPGHVQVVQTDGGPEFKGEFAQAVGDFCERHRLARPYKKNEQSYIESFNRTVRKECLGWGKYPPDELPALSAEVEAFLWRYHHHRPHLAFAPMRPPLRQIPAPEHG
jgi:transposase InsO family protein